MRKSPRGCGRIHKAQEVIMRNIDSGKITTAIEKMCQDANYYLGDDVVKAITKAVDVEESPSNSFSAESKSEVS